MTELDTLHTYSLSRPIARGDGLGLQQTGKFGDGVRIGSQVSDGDLVAHPLIRERYPVLTKALLAGASGQLRNKA